MPEREMSAEWPHVMKTEEEIVATYGHLFNNTGGNDPLDLLNDIKGPKGDRLFATNVVRYLLAFGVMTQVGLIASLQREGKVE